MVKRFDIIIATLALCTLGGAASFLGYAFVRSDIALLSDESCRSIVVNDVLGKPKYPETCDKSAYIALTENISESKEACMFRLQPIAEKEKNCPPIAIVVDRKTGEAWPLSKHVEP